MGETKDQALTVHTRKNYKKKENHNHNKKKDKKKNKLRRDPSNVRCYTCDEKDTLQETVQAERRDTMFIMLKIMNQQTKDSEERRMISTKSM